MGWGGVTVIWPADGQSDGEAIGAHFGSDVVLSENGDHLVEPTGVYGSTDKPDASWDEFLLLAEQRLRWRHPGSFRLTDPATDARQRASDQLGTDRRARPGRPALPGIGDGPAGAPRRRRAVHSDVVLRHSARRSSSLGGVGGRRRRPDRRDADGSAGTAGLPVGLTRTPERELGGGRHVIPIGMTRTNALCSPAPSRQDRACAVATSVLGKGGRAVQTRATTCGRQSRDGHRLAPPAATELDDADPERLFTSGSPTWAGRGRERPAPKVAGTGPLEAE